MCKAFSVQSQNNCIWYKTFCFCKRNNNLKPVSRPESFCHNSRLNPRVLCLTINSTTIPLSDVTTLNLLSVYQPVSDEDNDLSSITLEQLPGSLFYLCEDAPRPYKHAVNVQPELATPGKRAVFDKARYYCSPDNRTALCTTYCAYINGQRSLCYCYIFLSLIR